MAANVFFRYDTWVKSATGPAVPGAQIYVCTQPSNSSVVPPTPLAATFSDSGGLVPITQPLLTDGFGHADFYALPGLYTVIVALGGVIQQVYIDQSLGGVGTAGGGGGAPAGGLLLETNGTPNANQLVLNLQNTDGSVLLSEDGNGNTTISAQGAKFTTPNQGWFLGGQSFSPVSDDTGHSIYSSLPANTVLAVQLNLDAEYIISRMSAYCITGSGVAQPMTAGLYSADGNTKLIDSGAGVFDMGTTTRKYRSVLLPTPKTVGPGNYWFVYGATTNSSQGSVLAHVAEQFFTSLINGIDFTNPQVTPTRWGTAANGLIAGALPATLGAITPLDNTDPQNIPVVMFIV